MLGAPAPLDDRHRLDDFDSGVPVLDDWLRRRSRFNQASGTSRTYVVADETGRVAAYYALRDEPYLPVTRCLQRF